MERFNTCGQQCNLGVENFRITLVQYTVLNYKQKRKQQNASWQKESNNGANIHTLKVGRIWDHLLHGCKDQNWYSKSNTRPLTQI